MTDKQFIMIMRELDGIHASLKVIARRKILDLQEVSQFDRLQEAAHKAAASGSREDLDEYLKLRISMTEQKGAIK